jgi:hypothetical protein
MKMYFFLLLLAASSLCAQGTPAVSTTNDSTPNVVRLIQLKYADANRVKGLFDSTGVSIKSDGGLNSIVLRGEHQDVDQVERLIRQLDVPEATQSAQRAKPNIEFQVYIVTAKDDVAAEQPMPKALEPAITQLRAMFPFKTYRLVETIQTRVMAGESVSTQGSLAKLDAGIAAPLPTYMLSMQPGAMTSASDPVTLRFSFNADSVKPATASNGVTTDARQTNSNINTHFSIMPGQLIVVGKSGYGDASLFLIVSAKVAN